MPSTSPSHCSASCAQSASSDAADEALEQPHARREQLLVVAVTLVDRDANARDAGVRARPVCA